MTGKIGISLKSERRKKKDLSAERQVASRGKAGYGYQKKIIQHTR
jgi:hypothetical protein